MQGWIKIDRSIQDHWIWQDPIKMRCWVAMLLNASHSHQKVLIGGELVECHRGQIVASLRQLSETFMMNKDSFRHFLSILIKEKMISLESYTKFTRITICNYEGYQGSAHDAHPIDIQSADSYKNEKNEKKNVIDKKGKVLTLAIGVDKFNTFWEKYGKKESRATALKAWEKLSDEEQEKVISTVDAYVAWKSDVQFRKLPATYLNQKCFNDEIPPIFATPNKETTRYQPPANAIY
jgi:hypothetical protein